MRLLDANGRPVQLGGEIARGGEGVVYDIAGQPGSVAKIYLAAPDRDRAEKIAVMTGMATDRLIALAAWPTAALHRPGGGLAGFVMPKLAGHRPVFQVYGPKLRLRQFPRADWRFLVHAAGNVARAFAAMHEVGLVIGDVNHGNLLVAQDATVRFIDADSMQVSARGRVWPCEVGVGTHQPPEMQGLASYRGVVRTPNHDAFGLAVLVFQLLCMGRHPFSGRFAGRGEQPSIEDAIIASRYAYSADSARTQMTPPPGSLPMAALPASIRTLFEQAFAPGAASGGRPAAARWSDELAALGGSLQKCGRSAAHWYAPVANSCPWCEVEAQSGVAMFPAVFVAGRGGADGVALLWQEIQALDDPGPLPRLRAPDGLFAQPAARMLAAGRRLRRGLILGGAVVAALALIVFAALPAGDTPAPLAMLAVLAAIGWRLLRPREMTEARAALAAARALWVQVETQWVPGPAAKFAAGREKLAELKREYDTMAAQRERELQAMAANRKQEQFRLHLESFEIASAKIANVGKAKVATLLSYGIETAADIVAARIEAIPGFGPRTAANMLAFRQGCEASFRFNPARAVAQAQVAAMDGMLAQRRDKIEAELASGLAQLRAIVHAEGRHRDRLEGLAAELRPRYAQALADSRAVGLRI